MVSVPGVRTKGIAAGLAFSEDDCRRVIAESWSRYTGQPATTQTAATNPRAPGFFGLTQRRRWHLFKMPEADPVLPGEMGEYPRYQSDFIRQKHWELVGRLIENRFKVECTPSPDTQSARAVADRAEWVLTYGCQSVQERTSVDWQKALAEAISAYGIGYLHWSIAPELTAKTPDAEYRDVVPEDRTARFALSAESVDGDSSKGKYKETAASVTARTAIAKARAPFPMHVEVVAPDQVAVVEDESSRPGPALLVHIKEVGIIDYNGKLAKEGLRLDAAADNAGGIRLSMQEFDPDIPVGLERPGPTGAFLPSVAGWKQRIAIAYVWTRDECYELAAPTLLSSGNDMLVSETGWMLVKASKHGYGRVPYCRAFATVEQNEWDPALRFQPALAGLYAGKPFYDYTRALEVRIATEIAIKRYFITQDKDAPPALEGDEEGDQVVLSRDSAQAQTLPPGAHLEAVGPEDMSPAFIRSRELQGEELERAAPPSGRFPLAAHTQPWTVRLGQAQESAYPTDLLLSIAKAIAEMVRNWVELAQKPAEEGGLGVGLYVPGHKGTSGKVDMSQAVGMEPEDWDGIWVDIEIDPTSAAERVTQTQLGVQLLNNPVHITTPEQFVRDDMGEQDASGWMRTVESYWAMQPFKDGKVRQMLAEFYGREVVVGADGTLVNGMGQEMAPQDVLAQNGVRPAQGGEVVPPLSGMQQATEMPALPTLSGNGAGPLSGIPTAGR